MAYVIDDDFRDELLERIRKHSTPMQPEPTEVEPQLQPLKGIKAVLFDIYGTLFTSGLGELGVHETEDAPPPVADALEDAGFICMGADAGERGAEILKEAIKEDHERVRAEGVEYPEVEIRDIWEIVVSQLADEGQALGDVSPASLQRLSIEYEGRINPVWPMPKAKDTLLALREGGLKLGIVSNAQFYTPLIIELFDAVTGWTDGAFDPALCAWSYELRIGKPSEQVLAKALQGAEAQGIKPEEIICVGNDLLNDIKPARDLGCKSALFAGDKKSLRVREDNPACQDVIPDVVITELEQLKQVLL